MRKKTHSAASSASLQTILFDCYRNRGEVLQVIDRLIEEGISQSQIGIITPEIAKRMATGHARERFDHPDSREHLMRRFTRTLLAEYYRGNVRRGMQIAATCTLTRVDPLVRALVNIGLSRSDALLGAAQSRAGATLVIIYPQVI